MFSLWESILFIRYTTKKPEKIRTETLKLVRMNEEAVYYWIQQLLDNRSKYEKGTY